LRLDVLAELAGHALAIGEHPDEQPDPEKHADGLFGDERLVSDDRQRRKPAEDQADADEQPAPDVRDLRLRQAAVRSAGLSGGRRRAVLGHLACLLGSGANGTWPSMAGLGPCRQAMSWDASAGRF